MQADCEQEKETNHLTGLINTVDRKERPTISSITDRQSVTARVPAKETALACDFTPPLGVGLHTSDSPALGHWCLHKCLLPEGHRKPQPGASVPSTSEVAPPQENRPGQVGFGQRPCTTLTFETRFVHGRWPIHPVSTSGPWAMPKAWDVNGRWPNQSAQSNCVTSVFCLKGIENHSLGQACRAPARSRRPRETIRMTSGLANGHAQHWHLRR